MVLLFIVYPCSYCVKVNTRKIEAFSFISEKNSYDFSKGSWKRQKNGQSLTIHA